MPKSLEGLTIGEVSGVDSPAHLEEGWMVLKSAGVNPSAVDQVERVEALVDAVEKAADIDPTLLAAIGAEVLDATQLGVLKALGATQDHRPQEAHDMPDFDKSTLDDEARAYVEDLEAKVAKAASESPEDEIAKAMDGLPEPLRKHFTEQAEELRKAREVAEAERDTRLNAEYLAKARSFEALGEKPEELAPTLRKLADLDADLYVEVERLLKAANAQAEASDGLFKAIGASNAPDEGSAHGRLDAIAKAKVSDGSAPDYASALAKAAEENPDLYAAHRRESITGSKEG